MTPKRAPDRFTAAFDRAAGRPRASGAPSVAPEALAFASRVLEARRAGLDAEPCPSAVRARLLALPLPRARRGLLGILRLVLDSALSARPATRGRAAARLLRFEAPQRTLDVRIEVLPRGRRRLDIAWEGERPEALRLWMSPPAMWKRLTLDDAGGAVVTLAASVTEVRIEMLLGAGGVLRTPPLPLEAPFEA